MRSGSQRRHGSMRSGLTLGGVQEGRLHSAETEFETVFLEKGSRELDRLWIAGHRGLLQRGAAGVGQTKHGGGLVECFAGGVVGRCAEQFEVERRSCSRTDSCGRR